MLSPDEISSVTRGVIEEARTGSREAAWHKARPLLHAQHHQREAAKALLVIVDQQCLSLEAAAAALSEIAQAHHQDIELLATLGQCLEAARDIDDLNSPPPIDTVFYSVVEKLAALAKDHEGLPEEEAILNGLATSARILARQRDEIAENSLRRLSEINPRNGAYHYHLGLFLKTRGRFDEGMRSNQTAASLADEAIDSYQWNLGICATGAGNGAVALDVWKRMGQAIEIGRFGLPEGRYPQCKVKLAERPLAERSADTDDPGSQETVWIERLSPCHGIVRSVLYGGLGVDYGDVILMDGAPITHHNYGGTKVAVFPHLATLVRRNYQFFDFAGTQDTQGQLSDATTDLDDDAIIYVHSETYRLMCANCWRDSNLDHERHDQTEMHVVFGRIAAPRHIDPIRLLARIDGAIAKRSPCHIYVPDLCAAAGLEARALVDKRRFDLLKNN
jgi:tetratricopeptide (TPR) repeat protein